MFNLLLGLLLSKHRYEWFTDYKCSAGFYSYGGNTQYEPDCENESTGKIIGEACPVENEWSYGMMHRIKCADGSISLKLKVYICVQHANPDSTAILFRTQHHLNNVPGNQFAKQVLAARIKYSFTVLKVQSTLFRVKLVLIKTRWKQMTLTLFNWA